MLRKVKKSVCAGLDVHKDNVWACVGIKDPTSRKEIIRYSTKKFSSNYSDLVSMCEWMRQQVAKFYSPELVPAFDVFMESTGKYSTPVYNVIEEQGLQPFIVNPRHVKTINGQKTDQKDCCWIAQFGQEGLITPSYIPEKRIRELRRLSRTRTKLVQARGNDIRRIQNVLTEANIRIDLIFSDMQGQSAQAVIRYLLETEEPTLQEVRSRIHSGCSIVKYRNIADRKEKEGKLLKAFEGASFSSSQKFELRSALTRIDQYSEQIISYENMMKEMLEPYKCELDILETIPGISSLSAMQILAEIGADMSRFKNSDSFVNWCGLCPARNSSNGKHKSVKIGKGGQYLKPVLTQCALNAIRHPYFKKKYESIARRRGKKRALIAICRKIMVCVYHMLKTGEIFQPSDMTENSEVRTAPEKKKITAVKDQLIEYIRTTDTVGKDLVDLALNILKKAEHQMQGTNNLGQFQIE